MNAKASFLFAKRILFPKSGRLTIARKSLTGAILCIGISLTPLVGMPRLVESENSFIVELNSDISPMP